MRFIIALIMLLLLPLAQASTIHGTIYDISLNKLTDVKVTINTLPPQTLISKDGNYRFEVGNGNYNLAAVHPEGTVNQGIDIEKDGDYTIDLILFPATEDVPSVDDTNFSFDLDTGKAESNGYAFYFIIIVIALIFVLVVAWLFLRAKMKRGIEEELSSETSDELKEVVEIIKKQGGRITQKDLRKELPLSEAKISLLVADLESQGIVKKIKKGRGNIIVLN